MTAKILTEGWPDHKTPGSKSAPVQASSEPVDALAFPAVEVGNSPVLAADYPEVHGVYSSKRSDKLKQLDQSVIPTGRAKFSSFFALTMPKLLRTVMKVPGALTKRHGLIR
jgi:hypothetical protein